MTDFKALNAPLVEFIKTAYSASPSNFSTDASDRLQVFLGWMDNTYEGVSDADFAGGLNALAFDMRRLGYPRETTIFAQLSNDIVQSIDDQEYKTKLMIANYGMLGYAAMTVGEYKQGLDCYEMVDELTTISGGDNAVAKIKSLQNRGQICHRIGMNLPESYAIAHHCFDQALDVLENSDLNDTQKLQFRGQIGYCYAKTLTHMARLYPDKAKDLLSNAFSQIKNGLDFVKDLPNFDFERACFNAVLGDVYAADGQTDKAREILTQALADQQKFGPTLAPRIAATMFKLQALPGGPELNWEERNLPGVLYFRFMGNHSHPDLKYYNKRVETVQPAAAPKPAP